MSSPPAQPNPPALPSLILLSHHQLPSASGSSSGPTLQHPEIVYHFLDDPPLALVPGWSSLAAAGSVYSPAAATAIAEEKEVLVMDWDPAAVARGEQPVVRSLTTGLAVKGVKVDWEGVPAGPGGQSEGMIVIDTIGLGGTEKDPPADPLMALNRLALRNSLIREALDYQSLERPQLEEELPSPDRATERDPISVSPTSTV